MCLASRGFEVVVEERDLHSEPMANGQTTRVLVEQFGAVDASCLGELSGHLSPEEMWGVDEALSTVLGLN